MYPERKTLKVGLLVEIKVAESLERGYIYSILSQRPTKKGVKVELHTGEIGRVVRIVTKEEVKRENFVFYNKLLYKDSLFSLYDNQKKVYWSWKDKNGQNVAFLFDEKENADTYLSELKSMGLNHPVSIRAISSKRRRLSSVFSRAGVNFLIINRKRRIHLSTLVSFEERLGK